MSAGGDNVCSNPTKNLWEEEARNSTFCMEAAILGAPLGFAAAVRDLNRVVQLPDGATRLQEACASLRGSEFGGSASESAMLGRDTRGRDILEGSSGVDGDVEDAWRNVAKCLDFVYGRARDLGANGDAIQSALRNHTDMHAGAVSIIAGAWENPTEVLQSARGNSLEGLDWRLGVAIESSIAKSSAAPVVSLSWLVRDVGDHTPADSASDVTSTITDKFVPGAGRVGAGHLRQISTELSIEEFRELRARVQDAYDALDRI